MHYPLVFSCFLLFQISILPCIAQTQVGQNIDGEAGLDRSGHSVSMPDAYTLAIGAPNNTGKGTNSGHVRIYHWNDSVWIQKGKDIDAEAAFDVSGWSVSMPDSNTVAIGAWQNDGNGAEAGHVRIYRWNGIKWIQKGIDIDGEAAGDESGSSVSMPDSNTIAISAQGNDGNGNNSGHVRIYRWNSATGAWQQKGADIDGKAAFDQLGWSISMPDSNTIAIGTPSNDGNGANSGQVQIYRWNSATGAWQQKGANIDGKAAFDQLGWSVSMPDSNTIAIGAPNFNGVATSAGLVRIYKWTGSIWSQIGSDIDGEAVGDRSGFSVSMADSNIVAIGARDNVGKSTNIFSNAGHVRVYQWDGVAWHQKGVDIDGIGPHDQVGQSVSMPDKNTLAIGALGVGGDRGQVRVYSFCVPDSTTEIHTACDSFTWINGLTYTSSTNSPNLTFTNSLGCDSVVSLNLTINTSNAGTDVITACDSYTWIDGITYTTSTNSPAFTLTNALGCDSVITLNLTINNSNTGTDVITSCDSYTWIDGISYTTSTNSPTFTLTNAIGCDSVITLNLTINNSNTGTDVITSCNPYTWIDGITYTTSSNTPTFTLVNSLGCDSVVTLNLSIVEIDTTVELGMDSLISNQLAAQYQWLSCEGNFNSIQGATMRHFLPSDDKLYACEITLNGCVDTTACHRLVKREACTVDFPNVFTPNNDLVNDFFKPIYQCEFQVYKLLIFNRFGQQIFSAETPTLVWDGRIKGQKARSGTYFYILEYKVKGSSKKNSKKGSFTLLD